MITHPTVLVLGAGASMPYGFPSGKGLKDTVISKLQSPNYGGWHDILKESDIRFDDISKFSAALSKSGQLSIDAFLEHRPEFMEIGKFAIALSLIQYEEEHKLFEPNNNESCWYDYLFNKLNAKFEDFSNNKLAIITFNYDRSLEEYLFTCLKNSYGKSEEECCTVMNQIPIVHVHGNLGNLPWQGGKTRYYSHRETIEEVYIAAEKIIIISEIKKSSKEFDEAKDILFAAKRIYFLGFGYNDTNLTRLGFDTIDLSIKKRPIGTSFGLGRAERDSIVDKWNIDLFEEFNDNIHFLKNHAKLD